jgi:uncharacterized protein
MRIVLDTNVLVAAFGSGGLCRQLLRACLPTHEVCLSEFILEELSRNLRSKFHLPAEVIDAHLDLLRTECELVQPAEVGHDACRDPDDLPVLGTVLAANADCLVTGDRDLLALGEFRGRPILSPRQMLDHVRESGPPA